jgi:hypothetical protein
MSAKDKEALLKIAEAWEDRAQAANGKRRRRKAKSKPDAGRDRFGRGIIGGYEADALRPRGMMPEDRAGLLATRATQATK